MNTDSSTGIESSSSEYSYTGERHYEEEIIDSDEQFFRSVAIEDVNDEYLANLKERIKKPEVPVFLQFNNICYDIKVGKKKERRSILKNISGKVAPGEFMAIMGPTGSGKTTLLSILSDRVKSGVTGDIIINGRAPTVNYKRQFGYIQQDDLMFGNLTVQQTFDFTANIALPDHLSAQEKKDAVEEMFDVLGLEKARDTQIGGYGSRGISGGERKRVNIGNQLIKKPSLILLDEPTSGLDTSTALNLVKMLKAMCAAGMTVVTTIHQPSSQIFELFDTLLLMVDGRSIYYGKANKAITYFSSLGLQCEQFYNPADFMMGLILKEEISNKQGRSLKGAMISEYKKRIGYDVHEITSKREMKKLKKCQERQDQLIHDTNAEYPTSFGTQFVQLFKRSWFDLAKVYLTGLNLFQIVCIAVIAGAMWFQNPYEEANLRDLIGSLFFVSVSASGMFPAFTTLFNFPKEKNVVVKERNDGLYRLSSYFISKVFAEIPYLVVFPFIFGVIAYLMCGFILRPVNVIGFFGSLMAGAFASSGFGLAVSAAIDDPPKAPTIALVFLIAFMILGGFYVSLAELPIYFTWLSYLSFFKWTYNGLLCSQFVGTNITQDLNTTSFYDNYPDFIPGEAILEGQFVQFLGSGYNVLMLLGFGVMFRILSFVILFFTLKPKK
eukprot:TRINITY_DN533_c0_g1_i1.p1 TRINITY_DN533_c0_g1~~TRINITY_DN533_c0_g1_i1.p1  ORF type:complete len:665 (+),score=115.58 TRINITY_DN533_c0_g1_i1:100-2094(+)